MGLNIIAEAVLRIEHKLDALLSHFKVKLQPMHFVGQICPGCEQVIDYVIDFTHQVVTRRCGCKTGKIPSTIPLTPVGVPDGQASRSSRSTGSAQPQPTVGQDAVPSSTNRSRRQGR